jgi:hypothetical protein
MPIPVRSKDDTVSSVELQLGGYRSAWVFCGILHWRCLEVSSRSMPIPVRSKDDTVSAAELQLGGYRSAWVFCGILHWRLLGSQQSAQEPRSENHQPHTEPLGFSAEGAHNKPQEFTRGLLVSIELPLNC